MLTWPPPSSWAGARWGPTADCPAAGPPGPAVLGAVSAFGTGCKAGAGSRPKAPEPEAAPAKGAVPDSRLVAEPAPPPGPFSDTIPIPIASTSTTATPDAAPAGTRRIDAVKAP